MNTTALVWLGLVGGLSVASLFRATYGFSVYLLTFFLFPSFWWWGRAALPPLRWNLFAGMIFLLAVILQHSRTQAQSAPDPDPTMRRASNLILAIAANATLVHVLFAPSLDISMKGYIQLIKFVLLFFLIVAAVRNPRDLRLVLWSIVLGAAYLGYEVTVNDRGKIEKGRLEYVGAAGVDNANQLASLLITVLPLAGGLFFWGRRVDKVLVALTGPLILNVILQCNSRGAFLALIGGAIAFLVSTTREVRKKALFGLGLAGFAIYLLLGNARIVDRFITTFASEEERDSSASGRLLLWQAGFRMLFDYPLGAGGDGFKRATAAKYLPGIGIYGQARSVHNGILNEACEWGVQGLVLRMLFLAAAFGLTRRTVRQLSAAGKGGEAALGCCLIAALVAFTGSALFGDYMDDEWGYWIPALMVAYARVYGRAVPTTGEDRVAAVTAPARLALGAAAGSGQRSPRVA